MRWNRALVSRYSFLFRSVLVGRSPEKAHAILVSFMEDKNSPENDLKRDHKCIADEAEPDSPPMKRHVKEASNEEVLSEVSNPTVSLKETTVAFHDITSQPAEVTTDGPRCSEDTSKLSGNFSLEESCGERSSGNDESSGGNGTPASVTRSCVVLEIPEHACTTGIRKIKFSFSKRNESVDNDVNSESGYGTSEDQELGVSEYTSPGKDTDVYRGHSLVSEPYSFAPNVKLKMSKNVVPNGYPTNVKMLLSSCILNGARVKYMFSEAQHTLHGIISGGGYICGCSSCNFTEVVSAYEFEQHAGFKTRHPNKHIYLENGKPIYRIIQEIKTAPVGLLDQVIRDIAGSAINEKLFHVWKDNLQQNSGRCQVAKKQLKNMRNSRFSYLEERISPTSYSPVENNWSYYAELPEKRRHPLKQLNSPIYKSVKQQKKAAGIHKSAKKQKRAAEGGKRRDNDLHKLLFMPNGLPDGAELVYFVKGQRLLEGYKQGSGIVCSCCNNEISPSQFEAHAGMAARRQPYRHIYTSQGLTLHDIAMSLADGQVITTGGSDDMCTVCGEGGNLVLCAGCPRAFHAACLGMHSLPEGDWCCSSCRDKFVPGKKAIVGDLAPARHIVVRLTRIVKAPEFEIGGCAVCRAHDFSISNFDDRTVMLCDQCEKEFHVGCMRDAGLCDLTELPKDKWFCCDDCNKIHMSLQRSVSTGLEKVPALYLDAISRKLMVKGIRADETDDVQWRILNGKSRYQEHLPLLSRATAIFRECFDPIVAASGRDLIPVMVYGRNISGQEFGGMYCIVLTVNSVVVSAGLLRIFGKEVAELPLVATAREHQGKGYFQALFSCIEGLLRSFNVEKMVLPAAEEAESIWTKRFGFRKMNEERLRTCMRQVSVTMFKGTSMLEREVQHHTKD